MMSVNTFVPKQAIAKDVDLYAEITANSTEDVARAIFENLHPIAAGSKIHDNGCGAGAVTSVIMDIANKNQLPLDQILIEATDTDVSYLDRLRERALDRGWPVTITNMAAEELTFTDHSFDISVANFVIFLIPGEGITALEHMRRTLKPGGTAIFTAWARLPHVDPARAAHLATRGTSADVPPLREIPPQWWLGSHLRDVAIRAGFEEDKVELRSVTVYITAPDERYLARVLWSYLGPPLTGWLESDEENWDRALDVVIKSFGEIDGFQRLESGELRIELTANVILAST